MRRSEERILTTHTGSLPRPPELTRLYVRRARGESVDATEIETLGRATLRGIVKKQAEAAVDIANNGEQQREGFTTQPVVSILAIGVADHLVAGHGPLM